MVYTTVRIVLGIAAVNSEIKDLKRTKQPFMLGTHDHVIITDISDHDTCRDPNLSSYIIGIEVHRYWRYIDDRGSIKGKPVNESECSKCTKYTRCDTCIGMTNNGTYDVRVMVMKPTEVNLRHVCQFCYSDNRKDLMAPRHDLPLDASGFVIEDKAITDALLKCSTCGRRPDWRFSPETVLKRDYRCTLLKTFLQDYPTLRDKEIKFYYLLDDCLCCT